MIPVWDDLRYVWRDVSARIQGDRKKNCHLRAEYMPLGHILMLKLFAKPVHYGIAQLRVGQHMRVVFGCFAV